MKPFKTLLIAFAISISALLPQELSWACGPMPALPEDFRLSVFDAGLYDKSAEFSPYYFSLNRYYKNDSPNDFATQIETDQNYEEWQQQLKSTPFSKRDFYKAVEEYSYLIVADSANDLRKSNSFVNALLHHGNEAYYQYFKLAKSTEGSNGDWGVNVWGLDSYSTVPDSLLFHLTHELTHTQNRFIRQRTAYLLCRLFFYYNDAKNLQSVYNKYLNQKEVHSWVKAAAKYYSITALNQNDSGFTKDYCRALIDVIDRSKDKRLPCIRQLSWHPKERVLSLLSTSHEKATAIAAFAIRNPGYGLDDIKRIYSLDPNNKFLPLLLNREINKLEDWLLTPTSTEFNIAGGRDADYWDSGDDSIRNATKKNLVKDKLYANSVVAFINNINTHHRYDIILCHLYFLQKNWTAASNYCSRILQHANRHSPVHLQARVNHVIIGLQKEKRVSPSLQKEIYLLLTDLDKKDSKPPLVKKQDYYYNEYSNGYTLRDDLLVYLGRTALSMHDVVNASLLLSGTYKPWAEYTTGLNKNAYFFLYEHGRENDFATLLLLIKKRHKTPYENYFLKRKTDAQGNYTFFKPGDPYQENNIVFFWDVNKVLDIEGTHFIKEDNLPKALHAFQQIKDTFWTSEAYSYHYYLTGNPFILNLYDTHEYKADGKNRKPDNPNKAQFVQKIIELKDRMKHTKNREEKARLSYAVGNAYYSMSYDGKFWLMSSLWHEMYENESLEYGRVSSFAVQYYTAMRAKPYYLQAMQLTSDPEKSAFYCMYLTHCSNKARDLSAFLSFKKKHPDRWYSEYGYQNNPDIYAHLLKRRSGSYSFYRQIIDECPLYDEFRGKMERGL